jgi:hyperosmotically inducible periplasmic protein
MKSQVLGRVFLVGALVAASALAAHKPAAVGPQTDADIAKNVQHELLNYPYYGIFDDVPYRVQNGQVTLMGAVTQPVKKSDIKNVVASVPGVEGVSDQIEVLPLSNNDNLLRRQIAAAIYRFPALSRYGMGTHPSIHIIVDNGHVTLTGFVDSKADKDMAGIRAASAGLSFGPIVNNLQIPAPSHT